jgi:hypothetical protein
MRIAPPAAFVFACACLPGPVHADEPAIVIDEIHYHPAGDREDLEFVEILNRGRDPVDISGWSFLEGIPFKFPAGTVAAPGERIVVARSPRALRAAFGPIERLFGPWGSRDGSRGPASLSNGGEDIILADAGGRTVDRVDYDDEAPWPSSPDGGGPSLELVAPDLPNDKAANWRPAGGARRVLATPGAPNTRLAPRPPPSIRKVSALPDRPRSGDAVAIQAKVDCLDGARVTSVVLERQVVPPGRYIRLANPAYKKGWIAAPMRDDGEEGDLRAGDSIWTVRLPPQPNRTLVRYRIAAADERGGKGRLPLDDDECPNLAYFVWDGVPDYVARERSAHGPVPHRHPAAGLAALPVYHLIMDARDLEECWGEGRGGFGDSEFRWRGTFVFQGKVHDHIGYRLRGGIWRYLYQKRHLKLRFLRGHRFQGVDSIGVPDPEKRRMVNLNSTIGNPDKGLGDQVRGESGVNEALAFSLFRRMGVPAPRTTWVQLRVVRGADEAGRDQTSGDFFGLYIDIEQPGASFLEAHGLPEGNLYKIEGGWEKVASSGIPGGDSDIGTFFEGLSASPSLDWLESHLDIDRALSYRAVIEMAHHYDVDQGKNYFYYHDPRTDRWTVIPWDVDLTFNTGYEASGREPLTDAVLAHPELRLRFANRLREGLDLLFDEDHLFPLIDGFAEHLGPMARADRDRWEHLAPFASIEERMSELKAWIRARRPFLRDLCRDPGIPATPAIMSPAPRSKVAVEDLAFACSAPPEGGGAGHARSRWIATRVSRFSEDRPERSAEEADLVSPGSTWRFFRGRREPAGGPLAWTRPDYDDGRWEEGPGGFGYGDGDDRTLLADMPRTYSAVYIRRSFEVKDQAAFAGLKLRVDYDDGFAAYLNGAAVVRANAPARDPIPARALATQSHEARGPETFRLDPSALRLLRPGRNVLALQGLNQSLTSTDLSLDAALAGLPPEEERPPPGVSTRPPLAALLAESELAPDWDSGPTERDLLRAKIPAGAIRAEPGAILRVRARHEDRTGRWSHWSRPVEVEIAASLSAFRRGDAGGDGKVDLADAIAILLRLCGEGPALRCEAAADADDDGRVTFADALRLLRWLHGGGDRPPGPAACGPDPTPDALSCRSYSACP